MDCENKYNNKILNKDCPFRNLTAAVHNFIGFSSLKVSKSSKPSKRILKLRYSTGALPSDRYSRLHGERPDQLWNTPIVVELMRVNNIDIIGEVQLLCGMRNVSF